MKHLLTALLFFSMKMAVAQTAVTNTGILFIGNVADTLSAGDDFTNNFTAALTNNGGFYVKGDLSNAQLSMPVGTGTLFLTGGAAQSVNGSRPFKTYHLNTNNSLGITINNNLSVSGTHIFMSGMISTSATPNYLIYEAGSSYSGDADTRHVNGWVKKMGNTNFTFPVGDAVYERTVAVLNLASPSEINVHYYKPTPNIFNLAPPIVQVHSNEYWEIDQVSGGPLQVTLNWDDAKVPLENVMLSQISVSPYLNNNWRYAGGMASGNVNTTGSVTSWASASLFSVPFTIGYTSGELLPLKMISFTAERRLGSSFLHWTVENEPGPDHYDIQRSDDGIVFTTIGKVAALNLSGRQQYDFEDHYSFEGTVYYRLRSADQNGRLSYSGIVTVSERAFAAGNFIVVNPVRHTITVINKTGRDGTFEYRLFNSAGQQVLKGNAGMGMNALTALPLPSVLASGIYVLEIANERKLFSQKIFVGK